MSLQKEIFGQPAAVRATLQERLGYRAEQLLRCVDSALIVAGGTSYHAGLVARHWLEGLAALPCSVEIASEYRYRDPAPNPRALVVAISRSGESPDTLAAVDHAKALGQRHTLAICNVAESALARSCELTFLSPKAFTAQLTALLMLAIALARVRGKRFAERELLQALQQLPAAVANALRLEPEMAAWAGKLARREHALFLGRGAHYAIAMEGALKLKEISGIHAEAHAAGELKHGPLALVDEKMPVVAIAPRDALLDKLKSNLQEVQARGGELFVLAQGGFPAEQQGFHVASMHDAPGVLSPIVSTVPLQLLAYHAALLRGNDVDKPQ